MGYTHYFRTKVVPKEAYASIKTDFETLIPFLTVRNSPLAGWDGEGEAIINDEEIRFNGVGEDGHETMSLGLDTNGFNFCKTVRKPYDLAVTSLLVIASQHLGDNVRVSSDGYLSEWNEAMTLCQSTLGYGESFDFRKDD
jgi:hypothetical protein